MDPELKDVLFLWSGQNSRTKKVQALKTANAFLIQKGLPKSTKIKRVAQNKEPAIFKQYFGSWEEPSNDNNKHDNVSIADLDTISRETTAGSDDVKA